MEVYSWENYQFLRAMASMAMWNYRKVICQVVFAALLKWVYRGFPSMGNPENSCLVYGLEHPKQKNMNDVQMISGYSFKQRKARFGLYISKTEKLTVLMLQWPMKSEKLRLPGSDPSKRASLLKLLFSCIFEFLLIDMSGKSSVFWRIPLPFYRGILCLFEKSGGGEDWSQVSPRSEIGLQETWDDCRGIIWWGMS